MEIAPFKDILILLSFSVLIVFLLHRLKLPSILGFLVTGIIIGPYGFSLIHTIEDVEPIKEIGVILLLFVIGMELSIKQLAKIKKTVFVGGALQVFLTVLVAGSIYYFLGNNWNESLFIGFLFSLSSTAIVLDLLQSNREVNTPHGKNALGILIFQDIIVVPMMLFTPIIAGVASNVTLSIVTLLLKSVVVVLITIVSARYLVPKLMYIIVKTRSKELFLFTIITICLAVAYLTYAAGLSLALGAFLAGLIVSESEYSHQATSIVLPFRELFASFFFVSIGMLLDVSFFVQHIWVVLLIVAAIFVLKSIITALAILLLRYPSKTAILTGLYLFQIGEFAFVLSNVGIEYGLLSAETNQYFLAVAILSMILTPVILLFSDRIVSLFQKSKLLKKLDDKKTEIVEMNDISSDNLKNHLIIIGYGINGSNLAKAAEFSSIPYIAVEFNAKTVREEQAKGTPIIFGDASHLHILESVNIAYARAVVIAISDAQATKAITGNVRLLSKSVYLLVRTRFVKETGELLSLGADDVIPEEFETSIEIFSRVLHNFLVPEDDIHHFINVIRSDNYEFLENKKSLPKTFKYSQLPNFNITCVKVNIDSGKVLGKPLKELNLRAKYGINILGITRADNEMVETSLADETIIQGDRLFINGKQNDIEKFVRIVS